jgi:hypothetical protein
MSLNSMNITYPPIVVDGYWGQTLTISLKKSQAVRRYVVQVVPGTLTGGSSPAWNYSALGKDIITHIRLEADNEVIYDSDSDLTDEMNILDGFAVDGATFRISLADHNLRTGSPFDATAFQSYKYNDVRLYLTFNTLSNITTGSPTGSSNTMLYLQEESIPREVFERSVGQTFLVKRLQMSASLPVIGDNILTNLLPQTGAYKMVLFKAMDNTCTASDNVVSKVSITLNDIYQLTQSYWSLLKQQAKNIFEKMPDTGFAPLVFMDDDKISKLVYLGDTNKIKSVATTLTTTASSCGVKVLRVVYIM